MVGGVANDAYELLAAVFLMELFLLAIIAVMTVLAGIVSRKRPLISPSQFDSALTSVGMACFNVLCGGLAIVAGVNPAFRSFYDSIGIPKVDPAFWAGVPPVITISLGVLAKDFADYWNHRAMHRRWFWPFHAIHHSDNDVNGFSIYRIHILEALFMNASYVVIISWLSLPVLESVVLMVMLKMQHAYVHLDLDWDHGPFRRVIASPRFHRWHHADVREAYGKNLANVFSFYDVLFGTYYMPGPCRAPMGAASTGIRPTNIVRLITYPFEVWFRTLMSTFAKAGR